MKKDLQKKYIDLFRGNFKLLGYFVDELLAAPKQKDFFKILVENIICLFAQARAFEPFYLQWIKDKTEFNKTYSETEANAIKEIHDAFSRLHSLLVAKNLIEDPSIKDRLSTIKNILENCHNSQDVRYPYYKVAYEHLCTLCSYVLKLHQISLVKAFGEITYVSNKDANFEEKDVPSGKPIFLQFTFAPALYKLQKLDQTLSWDQIDQDWAVWEYFLLTKWCWETPVSFFESKILEYQDMVIGLKPSKPKDEIDLAHGKTPKSDEEVADLKSIVQEVKKCNEMGSIENTHVFWLAMQKIKNSQRANLGFFDRKLFTEYLKLILNKILIHQETHIDDSTKVDNVNIGVVPYSIELKLIEHRLLLQVEWFKDSDIETFEMHKFNDESVLHKFTQDIILARPCKPIRLDSKSCTIPKYMERVGFKGILEQVFFKKIDTFSAALKAHRVLLKDLPEIDLNSLCTHIKNLKRVESDWLLKKLANTSSAK